MTKHLGYGWLEFTGGVSEFTGGVSLILYCMNENHCEWKQTGLLNIEKQCMMKCLFTLCVCKVWVKNIF